MYKTSAPFESVIRPKPTLPAGSLRFFFFLTNLFFFQVNVNRLIIMVLVRHWGRLLGHGQLRRTSVTQFVNGPGHPIRRRTESNVVRSPFSDVEIPSGLLDERVWRDLERWPDKDALVSRPTVRSPDRVDVLEVIRR